MNTAWRAQDLAYLSRMNFDEALRPWKFRAQSRGVATAHLTARKRALLDLAVLDRLGKNAPAIVRRAQATQDFKAIDAAVEACFVDLSQNPIRQPWTKRG